MRHPVRRLVAVLLTLFSTALLVGVAAVSAPAAQAADCGYPVSKCACPSLSVSTTVPDVGERIRVAGANFEPRAIVGLELRPAKTTSGGSTYSLKSVRVRPDGTFATTVVMPAKANGSYDLYAVGGKPTNAPSSCPVDPSQRLRIGQNDASRSGSNNPANGSTNDGPSGTAFTGFNLLWLLLLAAVLLALGVYAVRRGRNKQDVVRSIHG